MRIEYDPDRYTTEVSHTPCSCGGYSGTSSCKRPGGCNGSSCYSLKKIPLEEYYKIKKEKQIQEENEILKKAESIKRNRMYQQISGRNNYD